MRTRCIDSMNRPASKSSRRRAIDLTACATTRSETPLAIGSPLFAQTRPTYIQFSPAAVKGALQGAGGPDEPTYRYRAREGESDEIKRGGALSGRRCEHPPRHHEAPQAGRR